MFESFLLQVLELIVRFSINTLQNERHILEMNGVVPVDGGEVPHPDVHLTARGHRQNVSVRTREQRRVEAAFVYTL